MSTKKETVLEDVKKTETAEIAEKTAKKSARASKTTRKTAEKAAKPLQTKVRMFSSFTRAWSTSRRRL